MENTQENSKVCEGPSCDRMVYCKGLCQTHYDQKRKGKGLSPIQLKYGKSNVNGGKCSGPECDYDAKEMGLCFAHYRQQRCGEELKVVKKRQGKISLCSFPECDRRTRGNGLCITHNRQVARGEELHKIEKKYRTMTNGYVKVFKPDHPNAQGKGYVLEHLYVMSEYLGRKIDIDGGENVHHRNGVKDDNNLPNLELWSRSQPSGQRVVDKLVWARQLIEQYGDEESLLEVFDV